MAKVIFIMTDSQRYDMVNANAQTVLHTPYLDRLAAEGMRFTRAYTTPTGLPARMLCAFHRHVPALLQQLDQFLCIVL